MRNAADLESLINIENQNLEGRVYAFELAIHFSADIEVRNASEPIADPLPAGRNGKIRRAGGWRGLFKPSVGIWLGSHSIQRRLHRTRGNFKRLKKKCANAHRHGERYEQYFDVLAPRGVRIGLKPFVRDLLQVLHLLFELLGFAVLGHCLSDVSQRCPDSFDRLRRKNIPLMI